MTVNGIILLTIVSSYVASGHAAPTVVNNELTVSQLKGEWFEIGKISDCSNVMMHPCYTHTILAADGNDKEFYDIVTGYENMSNCDRGIPYYADVVTHYLINSTIHIDGSTIFASANFTIKSYNNGEELIFTESGDKSCSSTSYKLWSRKRKVSAGTKAEFEKLGGNDTVVYYSYDSCPIVRGEVDEHSVKVKFDGLWYDIARIYYGDVDNDTCTTRTRTVNYEKNTFSEVMNLINDGRVNETIQGGKLVESGTVLRYQKKDIELHDFYGIRCNNGEDLIIVQDYMNNIGLMSHRTSAGTMTEFKTLADKLIEKNLDTLYTTFSHDNCPKTNE